MIHFETYHWEDHVPRKGSWKFNLAVGALAFGLIAAAMPDRSGEIAAQSAWRANAAAGVSSPLGDMPRHPEPVVYRGRGKADEMPDGARGYTREGSALSCDRMSPAVI